MSAVACPVFHSGARPRTGSATRNSTAIRQASGNSQPSTWSIERQKPANASSRAAYSDNPMLNAIGVAM